MTESGYYPPGAEHDPNAPWNQVDNPEEIVISDVFRPKYDLEFKDFFIPLQDCIERDSKRPNPIGEEVIRKTYEKYKDILKV